MASIEVPNIYFGGWQRWRARSRPSQDFDVPADFGCLGLYLFATTETDLSAVENSKERHLEEHVVYIGMSTHVEQRLERTHHAIVKYREQFNDDKCNNLWFAIWHSDWTNREHNISRKTVALASIALYERALLLAYATKYGRFPACNAA